MGGRRATSKRDEPARERGQATVEFAMVLPILILVLFGTVEFGHAFWTYQQVSAAASEGVRTAIISRSSSTRTSDVEQAAKSASPGLTASDLTVTTTSTWAPSSAVTVKVNYQLDSMGIGLLHRFGFSGTLTSTRTGRVEQ